MNLKDDSQIKSWLESHAKLVILIGANGIGKSRLLAQTAKMALASGRQTIAIANTPYDKFGRNTQGATQLLARHGKKGPEAALKRAIVSALGGDEIRLRRIPRVFEHCGYDREIGIYIEGFYNFDQIAIDQIQGAIFGAREVEELVTALSAYQTSGDLGRTLWIDLEKRVFEFSYRSFIPILIKWEATLKKLRIISGIKLSLMKKGQEIPLQEASSGELSLISSIAFISAAVSSQSVIVIDEPENSLHPSWQRDYFDLLLGAIQYERPLVVIATHAPLIVGAAESDSRNSETSFRYDLEVVRLGADDDQMIESPPQSMEGLLMTAFDTVTPENHYLSGVMTELLEDLAKKEITYDAASNEINRIKAFSRDSKQLSAIAAVERLARRISEGITNEDLEADSQ